MICLHFLCTTESSLGLCTCMRACEDTNCRSVADGGLARGLCGAAWMCLNISKSALHTLRLNLTKLLTAKNSRHNFLLSLSCPSVWSFLGPLWWGLEVRWERCYDEALHSSSFLSNSRHCPCSDTGCLVLCGLLQSLTVKSSF